MRCEDRAVRRQPRILDRHARTAERPREQHEALRGARADDDRLRVGGDAAHAAQVLGQRPPQLGRAPSVGVAEGPVGRLADALAQRAQPRPARKRGQVGVAGKEVEPRRAGLGLAGRHGDGARRVGHERARPAARDRDSPRRAAARRRRPPDAARRRGPMPAPAWPAAAPAGAGGPSARPRAGRPRAAPAAACGRPGRARPAAPGRKLVPSSVFKVVLYRAPLSAYRGALHDR